MKILITTDWYAPVINGVVTSVLNLKGQLEKRGHEVFVLTLSTDGREKKEDHVFYMKSFNLSMIYPEARGTVPKYHRYIQELIAWKPDVVHSQCEFMTYPYAKKIAKRVKAPLIHTYHTVYEDYTHYFTYHDKIGKKAVALWTKHLMEKVGTVVVPSEKIKGLLHEYGVESDIAVIPSGIDLDCFYQRISLEERARKRLALGIAEDQKVLVTVGRLAKEKNIQEIIRNLKNMKRSDVIYLIVGDGPYKKELEKLVVELEMQSQVIFTGMVKPEEVAFYYQLGDIFLSASTSETQGLTYIEALASGLPSVCRKDDCLNEVIYDGYNGYQFTAYEEFKNSVEALLASDGLRKTMGANARNSTQRFASERFGKTMEELYLREANRRSFAEQITLYRLLRQKIAMF